VKKKLLLLSSLYPNPANPVRGTFVQEQVEELAKEYQVRVIAWDFPAAYLHQSWKEGTVEVDYIRFPSLKNFFPSSIAAFRHYVLPMVKKTFRDWQPDLIHAHDFAHIPGLYVLKGWLDNESIPRFLTLHNLKSLPGMQNHPITSFIYRLTLPRALNGWTRIFAVSQPLANYLEQYKSGVDFIGNGIRDINRADSPRLAKIREWLDEGGLKVLGVGNLIETKGFDILINSVGDLVKEGVDIRALIVGRGPNQSVLQGLVDTLGLRERVWLYGPMPHAEVRNLYFEFDTFVLPSYSETFGITYLEAAYAGLPVVGVKGQGIWGIFEEGKEALFIEPRDRQGLAMALKRLAENASERMNIGSNARKLVNERFKLDGVMAGIYARYREVFE
jgi:glycosyltransferase involved in cell wall biosynthesis